MGAFRVVFSFVGKIMVLFLFLLASSVRERERFIFWITARPHAIGVVCGGCLFCFCQVFGPFIVFVILLI